MGLLRKLFCKEEPQPAPLPEPAPLADDRPAYVARSPVTYRNDCTCVMCGRIESVKGYSSDRGGWKTFHGCGFPAGGVEACPSCREAVASWIADVERHNADRDLRQRANRTPAYAAQRAWDAANPAPAYTYRPSTFIFIRRTTCGGCGRVEDHEGKQHELPSWPDGWQRVTPRHGPVVCPDCYEKHEPLREAQKKWAAERDLWVGGFFRAADEGLPPAQKLKLPSRWKS